jgi:transcriptional regulator with XRE-family HTH domain
MLRAVRLSAGLSLNALARRAGVDPGYLHRIENAPPAGPHVPRRPVVQALGRALGLDLSQTDDLLVRAGYSPEVLGVLGGWDPTLARVAAVLAHPGLSGAAKAELREVLHIRCARWEAGADRGLES